MSQGGNCNVIDPQYVLNMTEHLPENFQRQRKLLLPYFKEARANKKRTTWKAIDGDYCLFC